MTTIGSPLTALDVSEAVLAKIAEILETNTAEQKAFADDPTPYNYRVFVERDNAFMIMAEDEGNPTPVFNVRWDGTNFSPSADPNVEHGKATYHVECFAAERAQKQIGAHKKADVEANAVVRRGLRLARRYLGAAVNYHLGTSAAMVQSRQVGSLQMFRRDPAEARAHAVAVGRLTLDVDLVEYRDEIPADVLEILNSEDLADRLDWLQDYTV